VVSDRSSINWPEEESACKLSARRHIPGEPENRDKAGTTVFGGRMVLSAIFAQSLIMVNLPWRGVRDRRINIQYTHNHTVLPNLYIVSNSCCFHYRPCANMDVIANLHRIVVEIPSISLVRWSFLA
jgi:hypothetical protein